MLGKLFFFNKLMVRWVCLCINLFLFKLFSYSWFSFGGLYISRKWSISSRLKICWQIIVDSILLWFLYFYCILWFLLFHLIFCLVGTFYFLLSLARGLSVLFTLLKTSSWFYFFLLFLNLYFISFLSNLYYLLPSDDLRFSLFFLF